MASRKATLTVIRSPGRHTGPFEDSNTERSPGERHSYTPIDRVTRLSSEVNIHTRLGALLFSCLILSTKLVAADWPQFRGPGGQGHAGAIGLPLTWSETENVTWKLAVPGRGWSSPVILCDQIWMTTARETAVSAEEARTKLAGNTRAETMTVASHVSLDVICVEAASGELLHELTLFDVEDPPPIESFNSYASPTPVVEPGRLYCDFGGFGTACIDTETGKVLWKRQLSVDHQVGPGSSPILDNGLLILVRDGVDSQYITALDTLTGQTVWKSDRPPFETTSGYMKKAFSTPLVIESQGRRQMVVPGARWCVSYNPTTGDPIWRV